MWALTSMGKALTDLSTSHNYITLSGFYRILGSCCHDARNGETGPLVNNASPLGQICNGQ